MQGTAPTFDAKKGPDRQAGGLPAGAGPAGGHTGGPFADRTLYCDRATTRRFLDDNGLFHPARSISAAAFCPFLAISWHLTPCGATSLGLWPPCGRTAAQAVCPASTSCRRAVKVDQLVRLHPAAACQPGSGGPSQDAVRPGGKRSRARGSRMAVGWPTAVLFCAWLLYSSGSGRQR